MRTDSVVHYITKEMQPFNTSKKPAFQQMLETFDNRYELPGRTYVLQVAIPQLHNSMKDVQFLSSFYRYFWLFCLFILDIKNVLFTFQFQY